MSSSKDTTQSAADRRAAEAQLAVLITKFSPSHAPLVAAVRRALRKRLSSVHEVVYEYRDCFVISYSPSGHGYEGVLALRANEEGVRLYFNGGKSLPDPTKLLTGSGTQARWLLLEDIATLKRPEVATLIELAIEQSPTPFAVSGVGSVLVRPTSASKRSKMPSPASKPTAARNAPKAKAARSAKKAQKRSGKTTSAKRRA